ncbi:MULTISPECIES: PhoH family protein [Brevibacillus]|uniref:PhoH-like protein n=1 Tax=Brevibacillus laterosporus TaxID=1465 RepID=A0AAP3DD83_BRELA|nr:MULTISPECIES: PhoH family protein [Brevibacillus]ATO50724.1 phosphate starvation-inducible protein PhoH [Brevibacillus laterosporus DSM 25]AYB39071.1 PhoH family protein [Brevibacillus laterosporus]MBG9773758.1 phosphate starvation protein PhoH [Brevibacillus laterosporus]MBG9790715.1 phosphate starvation protein PhoH [Brevibacillus laterosporus]MBG9797982.1 phosphate starvation protein PhoH [Brevibacillus laterosporus]
MQVQEEVVIQFADAQEALLLFGPHDSYLKKIEEKTTAQIGTRTGAFVISGEKAEVDKLATLFDTLLQLIRRGITLSERDVYYAMQLTEKGEEQELLHLYEEEVARSHRGKLVRAKTLGQRHYLSAIKRNDIVFGIGPAGTGKTYLAVVMAVQALKNGRVKRIVLTRPAVEAGESLGFLPGDLQEKVDPYLRPLYDALYDMLGTEQVSKMMERGIIEVAPLAYMRGRTLEDSFIILDEAQNTTPEQMKMFLTRLGFGSKMVITGDVTQIDLPKGKKSGLREAERILSIISDIAFIEFQDTDVVRHSLVQKIITAYSREEQQN